MPRLHFLFLAALLSFASPALTQEAPNSRLLADFEAGAAPFQAEGAAQAVREHATEGTGALRLDSGFVAWDGAQNWSGYDFLRADVFNSGATPARVTIEVRDKATNGYWTRVNFSTVVPPGASVLSMPTDIYVGEKSRPGRALDIANITRLVFILEGGGPLFLDRVRLERDQTGPDVPGLRAFSFGPGTAPPLRGFTQVSPSTLYTPERGFGLRDARVWRAFDVLQPDPLYSRFVCIEAGGFALDLPDGRYHVFLNIDSPGGYWGEFQTFRERSIRANGVQVLRESEDFDGFLKRYFRFAESDDRLGENAFDKYLSQVFREKEFAVEVRGGQLYLEFQGQAWANCLSALVVYPESQAQAGRKYLQALRERRRALFDNAFKHVAPAGNRDSRGAIPAFVPTPDESRRGYAIFARDWMEDVPVNAVPRREEVTRKLSAFASAGEIEPVVFSLLSLRKSGEVWIEPGDLVSNSGRIPSGAIAPGVVSHRLSRVTMEGSVYTIAPRFVLPRNRATLRKDEASTFWLSLRVPKGAKAGIYRSRIALRFSDGSRDAVEVEARIFATPLDEVDVPAGPWGSTIDLPWPGPEASAWNERMLRLSLAKTREYGCTTFSGIPSLSISGWQNKAPQIDFARADGEMALARQAGFKSVVVNYNGGIGGFDNYKIDEAAMKAAGFSSYPEFVRAALAPIAEHARAKRWLPVAFNLCDEPIGDAISGATENARAWRQAVEGLPAELQGFATTTGATSVTSPSADDAHLKLARELKIANLTLHDEAAVRAIRAGGGGWAYYNDGRRWTFGAYMRKAALEGMKFRLGWHWNNSAGDPYYALDSREDDYSWCAANARGELIPTIHFERDIREGLDDYRYLSTLSRLLGQKPGHPHARAARRMLEEKMASIRLGEREAKGPLSEMRALRLRVAEAIEKLSAA